MELKKKTNINKNQKQKTPHDSQGLALCTKKELHLDSSAVLAGQTLTLPRWPSTQ